MTKAAAPRRRPALTARPWFPGALGLWFAALLGLSTLVVPPEALERAVTVIGLDRLFAAAAPPLGETARLLIAAAVGTIGEIFGLLLGYALARRRRDPGDRPVEVAVEAAPEEIVASPFEREPRRPVSAAELVVTGLEDASREEPEAPTEEVQDPEPSEPVASNPPGPVPVLVYVPPPPFIAPASLQQPAARAEPIERAAPPPAASSPPLAAAPLDGLGPPQLTERLAMALAARKERGDGVPGNRLGALAGLERARLGGWSEEASGEAGNEEEIEDDEEPGDESGYSSLLDIGRHHLRHAPETSEVAEDEDDEDVVSFPVASQHVEYDGDESHTPLSPPNRFTGSR